MLLINEIIRKIQKKGKKIYIWTANTDDEISKAFSSGANGIITDEVILAKKILESEKDKVNIKQIIIDKILSLIP